MKSQKKYRKKREKNKALSAIIGVGLILIGVAFYLTLRKVNAASASTPESRSVVPVSVNYPAPNLSLQNIQGEQESLAEFNGKVLLINNWATWCPPCKAEMPTLEKYYETYKDAGFEIVAIEAGEGQKEVAQFAADYGLQFHVWLDPNGEALNAFRNGNLPNSYVVDRAGAVRYAWTGEISFEMLEKFVTPLINSAN